MDRQWSVCHTTTLQGPRKALKWPSYRPLTTNMAYSQIQKEDAK